MSTFIAHTNLDGTLEVPIVEEFEYMGHFWVVHNSIKRNTESYRVSHRDTGRAVRDYRPGEPNLFDTVQGAIEHTKALFQLIGKQSVDHWIDQVNKGLL